MNITCHDCGEKFDRLSIVVSSEDWKRIADDQAYMLCYRCMDRRCVERGMNVTCQIVFDGDGLRTKDRLPINWRHPSYVDPHPDLYGWKP